MIRSREIAPASATYRGAVTCPERWETWTPRPGDVLVCTPPKCGTTWTQTMVAMLLAGTTDLPAPIAVHSPWADSHLGDPEAVRASLARQQGRRVVKTHTPADGFPVWEGVTVIAVYRHPLDVFVSLLSHVRNRTTASKNHRLLQSEDLALADYLDQPLDPANYDDDTLEGVVRHYRETALSGRLPDLTVLHYADMVADHPRAVRRLARALRLPADEALCDAVARATAFETMRAAPHLYVPEAGAGFWKDDSGFFAKGGAGRWRDSVPAAALPRYAARLAALLPDAEARKWLEFGCGR